MPKKHRQPITPKPRNTVHPSLQSSTQPGTQYGPSAPPNQRSVNDLLQHLRRTQLSGPESKASAQPRNAAGGSVHPSVRDALNLPPPTAPRPQTGMLRVGTRRIRRTPGPAPPTSWLSPNENNDEPANIEQESENTAAEGVYSKRRRSRLGHLPGLSFPPERSLQHMVLKSMAQNWDWHLICDHVFLSEIPTRVKQSLLSYIAAYTDRAAMHVRMKGFEPLFLDTREDGSKEVHSDVTRLDLSSAIGRWMSLKQLRQELKSREPPGDLGQGNEASVPASWDEEPITPTETASESGSRIPKALSSARFENLTFLSLANPTPQAASWSSLLRLLKHHSTLTHLSLAFWPAPTKSGTYQDTVTALPTNARSSVKSSAATESIDTLRQLSKVTYCLKWLDLEGCSKWISSLVVSGKQSPEDDQMISGPDWNGSWRGIEWLGLGPGWFPDLSDEEEHFLWKVDESQRMYGSRDSDTSDAGREKERRRAERMAYWADITDATLVRSSIRAFRKEGGGKWLDVSFGPQSDEEIERLVPADQLRPNVYNR